MYLKFRFEPVLNLVELVQVGLVWVWVWFTPQVVGSGSGLGKMVSEPNQTKLYQPYALPPTRMSVCSQSLCLWCQWLYQDMFNWGGMKQHIQKWHLNCEIRPQPPDPIKVLEAYEDYRFANGVELPWLDEANEGAGQCP